jgi:hypothetical protein
MFKSIPALAMLAPLMLIASPVFAAPDGAMADKKMGSEDKMAMEHKMSPADKKMMAKCHKMAPAKAAKNAKCAKMMMEADHKMDHAM